MAARTVRSTYRPTMRRRRPRLPGRAASTPVPALPESSVPRRAIVSALIGHPSLEEPELNEREQQRDAEQRDSEYCRLAVVLGELELVVDEVRQHVGRLQRPAPGGEQVDLPEGLEGEDRAHDDGEEDRGRQERQRHVPETRPGTGAVDLGRLLYVVRDRLEPGRHQDE